MTISVSLLFIMIDKLLANYQLDLLIYGPANCQVLFLLQTLCPKSGVSGISPGMSGWLSVFVLSLVTVLFLSPLILSFSSSFHLFHISPISIFFSCFTFLFLSHAIDIFFLSLNFSFLSCLHFLHLSILLYILSYISLFL